MKKNFRLSILGGLMVLLGLSAVYFTHQSLKLQQSKLSSTFPAGITLKGSAVKGAILTGTDSQGQSITLNIQDVEPDPKDREGEVYLYTVSYQNPITSQWQNICQPDREGTAEAVPLAGQWDSQGNYKDNGKVTFACTNSALAKCVRWGYKPWKRFHGQSLQNFHQACTRMVRADYCGTGIAHTKDGTPIDFYDRLGIQKRVATSGMKFEAAWNPDGAVAISRTRFPKAFTQVQRECPERLKPLQARDQMGRDSAKSLSILQQYAPKAMIFNDSFLN
jgi:ADYC domain